MAGSESDSTYFNLIERTCGVIFLARAMRSRELPAMRYEEE